MPDIDVTFRASSGALDTEHIDSADYDKGPPEVFPDGGRAFSDRSSHEQLMAWRSWLQDGHDVNLLKQARDLVDKARQTLPYEPPVSNTDYESFGVALGAVDVPITVTKDGTANSEVTYTLERGQYDRGPAVAPGVYDPGFKDRHDDVKKATWRNELRRADYVLVPTPQMDAAKSWYLAELVKLETSGTTRVMTRVMACVGVDYQRHPKASWSLLLGGLFAGLGAGGFGLWWLFERPDTLHAPGDVDAVVTDGLLEGPRVTVTWTGPALGPTPDRYVVSMTPGNGGDPRMGVATASATSFAFDAVAPATWSVSVIAFDGADKGPAGTVSVTVPGTGPQKPTSPPSPPTGVTLVPTTDGRRGITVTWQPPAAGAAPARYRVRLDGPTATDTGSDVMAGLRTSADYPLLAVGTYQAAVAAENDIGSSTPAASTAVTLQSYLSPDRPLGLVTRVFASRTDNGKAALAVMWERPGTGGPASAWSVRLISASGVADPALAVPTTSATIDPIADGTWTVEVAGSNVDATGATATTTVTVDHTKVDPDGIDWTAAFGPDQVTAWEALRAPLAAMDEQTQFWPHVLTVLQDTAGDHGGTADFPAQLFLAKLLTMWIKLPADPTDRRHIPDLATRLAASCSPAFPTTPASAYTGDPLVLWRTAQGLRNAMGTTPEVLRYKIFAIAVALERYLGVHS